MRETHCYDDTKVITDHAFIESIALTANRDYNDPARVGWSFRLYDGVQFVADPRINHRDASIDLSNTGTSHGHLIGSFPSTGKSS